MAEVAILDYKINTARGAGARCALRARLHALALVHNGAWPDLSKAESSRAEPEVSASNEQRRRSSRII